MHSVASSSCFIWLTIEILLLETESRWYMMVHGDAREGNWSGSWRIKWVASTLHTTSEHGVSSITTADAYTSADSNRLNWRPPGRFKWNGPFLRKTKSGYCACAITFQLASTQWVPSWVLLPLSCLATCCLEAPLLLSRPLCVCVLRSNRRWVCFVFSPTQKTPDSSGFTPPLSVSRFLIYHFTLHVTILRIFYLAVEHVWIIK